ncbi:MAG: NUDIX domain-containing protein [Bacteroidetes bacterium]|nr:NUDIX domain-containing protein [Bacteroidota bacterium]
MPQVYAVVYNGRGNFMIAFKNLRGYFFHNPNGAGGSIIPAGQPLNGANNWAFPGGALDGPPYSNARVIAGAIRELQEETGIEVGTGHCTPAIFGGGAYYAVYFLVADTFIATLQEARSRLDAGVNAVAAIRAGTYTRNDQYDDLMAAFNCPQDNELSNIFTWNLFDDWNEIERLRNDPATDWYYAILLNLRNQLFRVTVIDLEGRTVGVGLDMSTEPNSQYIVTNLLYDENRLLGEGEYIISYNGQRIEHVQFNTDTEPGGTAIFTGQ